ncbi:MAG: glutamate 5-kinase [Acidimicrobiales bacterium]
MRIVVKIGTSSLTDAAGRIDLDAVVKLCAEVAKARGEGHQVIAVSSGGGGGHGRPRPGRTARDGRTLQALSAVGQSRLMQTYNDVLAPWGLVAGQVLISPLDFFERAQYVHARATLQRLLELGVVPIINENDALADAEIRFGDNDRIAALVAHLVNADLLVLLTDTPGLFTADPRLDASASLIEEIRQVDAELEALAGGAGSARGSGGMASKLAAAKIAAWSGVRAVIAAAGRENVLADAVAGATGVGTVVLPHERRLSAKKLWIAFAVAAEGAVVVDGGARRALMDRAVSLLPVGVVEVRGQFHRGDAVELMTADGEVFAKGLVRVSSRNLERMKGLRTEELAQGDPVEIIHRDELVLVP